MYKPSFVKKIFIAAALIPIMFQCHAQRRPVMPRFLKEGDSIAVVAVSSKLDDSTAHCIGLCKMMERWGLNIRYGEHLFDTTGNWFPAPDSVRAADLQTMLDDPDIRAVIFFRGGYGAARTIPYLRLEALSEDPKWLVGFSDVTVMLYAALSAGVQAIHGTMPLDFGDQPFSFESLHHALFGSLHGYDIPPDTLDIPGEATAPLVGGNLTLVASVMGTSIDFDYSQPYILFLEDVDEPIYSTDRRMQTLKQSGRLDRCKGMIIGAFKRNSDEGEWGCSTYRLLHDYAAELGIPIIFGLPAGHIDRNCSLFMGRMTQMKVDAAGGHITWN
ncbi:MAG: LD-carboxypeptidase [Bacteroidales bacterium]|jgi:muramoyltetrapeptide carboxypeptidase|nr:LD-carboxypeptidase [Bacteroidales bacterium]MCI2122029.1 LD-carboxypeptidase [Bacteroidales bacterium]MCI2146216.1 LD-carboxypeptidase [Bacteroidales bacterium]